MGEGDEVSIDRARPTLTETAMLKKRR